MINKENDRTGGINNSACPISFIVVCDEVCDEVCFVGYNFL